MQPHTYTSWLVIQHADNYATKRETTQTKPPFSLPFLLYAFTRSLSKSTSANLTGFVQNISLWPTNSTTHRIRLM